MTVSPLDLKSRISLIESWFSSGDNTAGRERALRAAQDSAHGDIAGIPVLLGIIAKIAERDTVPTTLSALYDRYLQRYLAGHWRDRTRSPLDMRSLRDTAQQIAWGMATGFDPDGRVDGQQWLIRATRDQRYTCADGERAAVDEIIETDGLLVRHGDYDEPLSQQYRWIHRTIQEHLVGMHLVSMLRIRREPALEVVLTLAQTVYVWDAPLDHFMAALSPSEKDAVAAHLLVARDDGDPADLIQRTLERHAAHLAPTSPRRAEIVAGSWVRGRWDEGFQLAPEATIKEMSAAAAQGRLGPLNTSNYGRLSKSMSRDSRMDIGRRALSSAQRSGHATSFTPVLEVISRADPVAALDLYAEALHSRIWSWPGFLVAHERLPTEAARRLVNRVKDFETPTMRVLWLRAVAAVGIDARALLDTAALDEEERQVVLWIACRERAAFGDWFEADEPSAVAAAHAQEGAFGDYIAYSHARRAGRGTDRPCVAAEIGALLRSLAVRPKTVAYDEHYPEGLRMPAVGQAQSLESILALLQEAAHDAEGTRLPRLIELYRRLLVAQEASVNEHWLLAKDNEPALPLTAVAHDVMLGVQQRPKPEILRALTESDVTAWPTREENYLITCLVLDTDAEHGRADSAYRVLVPWSRGLTFPVLLPSVPPRADVKIAEELLKTYAGRWHPQNVEAVGLWLASQGSLGRYREKLLAVT